VDEHGHDVEHGGDYVWHFKLLDEVTAAEPGDALTGMVRRQITALLRCLAFTIDGADVRVTGFRFFEDPDHVHPLDPGLAETESPDLE
jgi:hypothetical protein